jgi:hypothetical protein
MPKASHTLHLLAAIVTAAALVSACAPLGRQSMNLIPPTCAFPKNWQGYQWVRCEIPADDPSLAGHYFGAVDASFTPIAKAGRVAP